MVDLGERFELPITAQFNVLREKIINFIDFKVPSNFGANARPEEFIRLYYIEEKQPVSIVHDSDNITLK